MWNKTDPLRLLRLTDTEELLCQVIQCWDPLRAAEAARQLQNILGPQKAYEFAARNGVESIMGHYLTRPDDEQRWRSVHDAAANRITAYLQELDHVANRLAQENITLVALKNSGIARGLFECKGCCPMGDLDVLVRRQDFQRAHEIVLSLGYEFKFRSPLEEEVFESAEADGSTEYRKRLENGEQLWLELQWRPISGR